MNVTKVSTNSMNVTKGITNSMNVTKGITNSMNDTSLVHDMHSVNKESAKPSGISHGFDTGYAIAYGVDEALMIHNLQHLIGCNATRGHNFHAGRYWTYDTIADFPKHFPYWSTDQVRRVIRSLVKQGVIIKGDFNGEWSNRTCWYAFADEAHFIPNARAPKKAVSNKSYDLAKSPNAIWENHQMPFGETTKCNIDTTTITTAITTTPSLMVSDETPAADAAWCEAGQETKPRKKKAAPEFSDSVREVTHKMLTVIRKHNPVYRPPADLTKFLLAVQEMLEKDEQDSETLLSTFEYAVADNEERGTFKGWQSIIVTNNKGGKSTTPAETFRKYFSKIHSQMHSKPKRKFAPSSDQDAALKCMEEMNKRAL